MNVTKLIEITNQLSTDKNSLTPKERLAYLQYLNMANLELYEIAASGLNTIVVKVDLFLDAVNNVFVLPKDLFKIDTILVNKIALIRGNIINSMVLNNNEYLVLGNSVLCNLTSSGLTFPSKADPNDHGTIKKYITLFYVPNPKSLVEVIDDANTETDTPVYPTPYQIFLVHGALYYFYFSNKVFMDKMVYIRDVWEKDKQKLANFKNYGL